MTLRLFPFRCLACPREFRDVHVFVAHLRGHETRELAIAVHPSIRGDVVARRDWSAEWEGRLQ